MLWSAILEEYCKVQTLTLSLNSSLAPACSKSFTASTSPVLDACMSAEQPPCNSKIENAFKKNREQMRVGKNTTLRCSAMTHMSIQCVSHHSPSVLDSACFQEKLDNRIACTGCSIYERGGTMLEPTREDRIQNRHVKEEKDKNERERLAQMEQCKI